MYIFKTSRKPRPNKLNALLRDSLKLAMLSRHMDEEDLAKKLTKRSGRMVKAGLVSAWKAETRHRWRLPADMVPIICEILEDDTIQRLLLSEKLKQSLDLGESAARVASLLQKVLLAVSTMTRKAKPRKRLKRSTR